MINFGLAMCKAAALTGCPWSAGLHVVFVCVNFRVAAMYKLKDDCMVM